jgi:hypothetical protein
MSNSLVTSSVTPSAFPTTFTVNTAHPKNETASQAINIGNLQEESSILNISDQGNTAGAQVSTTFTAQAGDISNLSQSFNNFVDQITTHFQLFDSSGNTVADNQGTTAQQAAYTKWVAGTLALNSDTYTATATPQASSSGSPALTLDTTQQQGTSLQVKSQLTGGDPSEYYAFTLSTGNNIKMSFDAGTGTKSTRVQLMNGNGNIIADSNGDAFQKANYIALTSGTGLTTSTGDYSIKVTYAPSADQTQNINYDMQLFSGTNYAVVYKTNATAKAYDNTASGSVTATSDAMLYTRQAYHKIDEKASTAVNIGWLAKNKSSLEVLSQLTHVDSTEYYSFTLQSGDNLKFGFDTKQTKNASDLRVQLLNVSGTKVLADSGGTAAQQAAYKSLTTANGLAASPGKYLVKITYAAKAKKNDDAYVFNLYSGTSFSAQYKTTTSPQTYANAMLNGNVSKSSTNNMSTYLTNLANGKTSDLMTTLSTFA